MEMDSRRELSRQQPSCDPTTTTHFFKIILDDTARNTKLRLPYKFVKKYGGELSNSASLKLSDGLEWDVDITRCGSKVWFEKGWANFSDFYSIDHGHFLVFGYQGNSEFEVCIFDKTTTEIDYSISGKDETSSAETLENCPRGSGNSRDESPFPASLPCKKNRRKSAGKPEINPNIQMDDDDDDDDDDSEESDGGGEEGEDQKEIALERANAYKPTDPHFVIVIKPSSTIGGYLHVPSVFSKRYLAKQPTHIMLRTVSDEKLVSVDMYYGRSTSRLGAGWPGFVRSNNLSVGDACVFVLKDGSELLFEVVFYRAT